MSHESFLSFDHTGTKFACQVPDVTFFNIHHSRVFRGDKSGISRLRRENLCVAAGGRWRWRRGRPRPWLDLYTPSTVIDPDRSWINRDVPDADGGLGLGAGQGRGRDLIVLSLSFLLRRARYPAPNCPEPSRRYLKGWRKLSGRKPFYPH